MSVSCSSHSLFLVVSDTAKYSVKSVSSFGVLQRLFNALVLGINKEIMKYLSITRYEASIDSMNVVYYYQLPSIVQAPFAPYCVFVGAEGLRDNVHRNTYTGRTNDLMHCTWKRS